VRLFLAPPEDPYIESLAQQSSLLFRAVRVQMTRQVLTYSMAARRFVYAKHVAICDFLALICH
jgi:hypothetical protein